MFKQLAVSTVFIGSLLLSGCSSDSDNNDDSDNTPQDPIATPGEGNSVYDTIFRNPDLSTLLLAIDSAGLDRVLDNEANDFTIFAPNNAAFTALEDSNPDDNLLESLLADPTELSPILTYHVVAGTTDATSAAAASENGPVPLTTVNGASVTLSRSDTSATGLAIGDASIVQGDVSLDGSSVGVVHIIDTVLLPPGS